MTIPPVILWAVAASTILAASAPLTRNQLDRYAELTGLTVTPATAAQIIAHLTRRRRRRLIALVPAVPLAILTDDPFYLVLGWCAVAILDRPGPPTPHRQTYRTAWQLSLIAALAICAYLLTTDGLTPAAQAHALAIVIVAAAGFFRTATRSLYLSAAAIVLSAALLTPGQPPQGDLPEYTTPTEFPEQAAAFTTAKKYEPPGCAFNVFLDDPCRSWQLDGQPFPQAAPYLIIPGKAPQRAPFHRSPNRKAVVYLSRHSRRMTYQDADQTRPLTGPLADTAMPTVTFARQNRYVALIGNGARIFDTRTWAESEIPEAEKVHDLNASGIVATTASKVLVLDHRGRRRMSLPLRKHAAYRLSPDGRVDVFDRRTDKRVSRHEPGDLRASQ